uniref:C2 domain-containing protein n=1 Tax=Seriola lalandi dorsalis TaxID=1841481 RepID=A0A3B4XDR0_SERLL
LLSMWHCVQRHELMFHKEHLYLVSAKPQSPKLPNRHSRLSSFVEVTADGLTSETKKTGKRSGHLELQWNEDLTLTKQGTSKTRLNNKMKHIKSVGL